MEKSMNHRFLQGAIVAAVAVSGVANAQVDSWEPVRSGNAVPTFANATDVGTHQIVAYADGTILAASSSATSSWQSLTIFERDTVRFNGTPIAAVAFENNLWWSGYFAIRSRNGGSVFQFGQSANNPGWHSDLTPTLPTRDIIGFSGVNESSPILLSNGQAWYGNIGYPGTNWSTTPKPAHVPFVPPTGSQLSTVDVIRTSIQYNASSALVGTLNGEVWFVNQPGTANATWRRLDQYQGKSLPAVQVNRVQIDRRDATGKTFLVVLNTAFAGSGASTWITKDGGTNWTSLSEAITTTGQPAQLITASFTLAANATGSYYGATGNLPANTTIGMRSDDAGKSWFFTPRWSGQNIAVEYRHYDNSIVGNQLYPTVRLRNLNSVPVKLEGLNLKYVFTPDGAAATNYFFDYSPYGSAAVQGSAVNGVLTLALHGQNLVAAGDASGEFVGRVAKTDWSNFDQSNDISYMASGTDYVVNNRIQLFQGELRLSGTSQPR
jgi:hypothetical protein